MSTPAVIKLSRNTPHVGVSPSIQIDFAEVEKMKREQKKVEKPEEETVVEPEEIECDVSLAITSQDKEVQEVQEDQDVPQYERILSRSKLMLEGIRPIVKDVLHQLIDRMREHQLRLSPQTIVPIVKFAMEIVEKTALKGIQKRELVNEMILHIVEASPMSDEQRELCRTLVDTEIIGNTVDVIVQASKGSLNINTVQEMAKSTTSCCFAFFARK